MQSVDEILVRLGLDATKFAEGTRRIKEQVRDWASEQMRMLSGVAAGYASIEGIKAAYEQTVEYASKLEDLSHRLGVSTDALQVWDFALQKNGGTIESAAGFFEKLAAARDKAMGGGAEGSKMTAEFKALGVSIDDLKNKRIEDIAEQIGEVFKAGDPQKLIGALKEVGGRGAGEVIATLKDGIAEARAEAERLGIVINKDVLADLKEAGDRWKIMGDQIRAGIAPALDWFMKRLADLRTGANAIVSALVNGAAALKEGSIMHPEQTLQRVAEAMKQAVLAEANDRADEENALAKKRAAADKVPTGGSDGTGENADHTKAEALDKQSAAIEEKAENKGLSIASRVAKLHLERNRLQEEYNSKTNTELEKAEARKALAENGLELQEALNEKKTKELEHSKKLTEEEQKKSDLLERKAYIQGQEQVANSAFPTIDALANSGWTQGSGGWNTREAQRIKWLQGDEMNARGKGNIGRAEGDMNERMRLTKDLQQRGIIAPQTHMESMDEKLGRIATSIDRVDKSTDPDK